MNKKPIRISANPSPFNQNEVNFVETMFYDELAPTKECPISRALGAPIPEEKDEESNNHDLRNLHDRKDSYTNMTITSALPFPLKFLLFPSKALSTLAWGFQLYLQPSCKQTLA